ncbi:MAG: hypothetical protein HQL63_08765 [Magnetococcales bacterium]|nr:hypothetical protein [Magnetococcales bacterium]MBF0323233.1 hypothetical protein [Magnetococcales bacterium]
MLAIALLDILTDLPYHRPMIVIRLSLSLRLCGTLLGANGGLRFVEAAR